MAKDYDYGQLLDDFELGADVMPGESLTDYIERRRREFESKANGGSIGIEVLFGPKREEYQTGGRTIDSRATAQDYANALRSVSAGTTYQQQADAKRYARNQASQMLNEAARAAPQARGIENIYNTFFKGQASPGITPNTFGRAGSDPNALMFYRSADRDNILDAMANQMLNTTQYSQPKINERREKEFADYMENLIASTYGKADDYRAEAMTLGMPTEAYFDYLVTSDPKDKLSTRDVLSRSPYFDPKTYVPTDYSNPETPRPPSPYGVYFQRELQRQIDAGIPEAQRIQQGQVMGLPTVIPGGAAGSQMGPGYESYADALARTRQMMGLKDGGRVGLFMGGDPLTGQALSIYESMNAYGFTDQEIANALRAQGLYDVTPAVTTPVINKAPNIINQGGGGDGNGGGKKTTGGLGLGRFDYGYESLAKSTLDEEGAGGYKTPGTDANQAFLDDIGEGTVDDENYTLGMRLGDIGTGIKGGFAKAYQDLRKLPTPFNIASKTMGNISDFFKQKAEEKARQDQLKKELEALALQGRIYGSGGGRDQSLNDPTTGDYKGRGDVGATTANQTGEFATDSLSYDLKDGGRVGLATMFTRRR